MSLEKKSTNRLLSLDVFRGLTIVGMILVNSPGNQTAYAWLDHSVWNGCTIADLVFPFFIFIVGVSLVFSLSKQREHGVTARDMLLKIGKRAGIIILLGLFLNAFPKHFNIDTLRFFGVLQRIAVCYVCAALLFLKTSVRMQIVICAGLLIGYWLLMMLVPVPGFGANNLTQEGNLAAYLDRLAFSSAHLYGKVFDPEGFLSTLPALATVLLGTITGAWLQADMSQHKKLIGMVAGGLLAMVVGWMWGWSFPINKAMWTSSFVLWTGGLALCVFGVCYWLLEIKQWRRWSLPLEVFGMNAIAAYFLHIFFLKLQHLVLLPNADGSMGNLRLFITEHLFGWASLKNASLFYSLNYILLWLVVLTILYRRKIFIKI
jgi:predicted acyltransferase